MAVPSMYSKVVDVISKTPDVRKDFEVHSILPWFRKKSQLFQKLKNDFLKDIIRNCRFITKNKDDVIIRQGDLGECFYIILGGQISIYILNKEDLENQIQDGEDNTKEKGPEDGQALKVSDRTVLGNFVCHLGAGDPFGEVALVSEDCIRTASIISDETTDLVVVDRALYNRSVRDVLAKEFEEKTDFIKGTPLFSIWAPKYRKQLTMALYKETFPYESCLVKQGDKVDNIYFIISGQVEVQIDPSTHPKQYPKLFPVEESEFGERIIPNSDKPKASVNINQSPKHRKRDNNKCIKVCCLGINASVGDTEVLMDMDTYLQTAICSEKTDVLVLERKHYERLFVKRHPKTIESMKRILEIKLAARLSMSINKDMPLLDNLLGKLRNMNNPQPVTEKPKRDIVTYHEAEKQFLNHKGPLIDMWGPGSVFYAIRLREKFKSRRRFQSRASMNVRHAQNPPRGNPNVQAQSRIALLQKTEQAKDGDTSGSKASALSITHPLNEGNKAIAEAVGDTEDAPSTNIKGRYIVKSQTSLGLYDTNDNIQTSRPSSARVLPRPDSTFLTESRLAYHGSHDSPTEEQVLQSLEDRMRHWLSKANPKGPVQVQQLRRTAVQNLEQLPRPGNKVVIRRRRRDANSPETVSSGYFDDDEESGSFDHLKILLAR